MKNYIVLFAIVLGTNLIWSQKYMGDEKDIEIILENVKTFSSYVMASDHDKISNCYTKDAKIFPNNVDIIEGKKAIANYWKSPEGVFTSYHKVTPQEIKIIGNEAYDYGYYEGTTKQANGSQSSWKGKYVIIWKKEDDNWRIYLDIWNGIRD